MVAVTGYFCFGRLRNSGVLKKICFFGEKGLTKSDIHVKIIKLSGKMAELV